MITRSEGMQKKIVAIRERCQGLKTQSGPLPGFGLEYIRDVEWLLTTLDEADQERRQAVLKSASLQASRSGTRTDRKRLGVCFEAALFDRNGREFRKAGYKRCTLDSPSQKTATFGPAREEWDEIGEIRVLMATAAELPWRETFRRLTCKQSGRVPRGQSLTVELP